MQLCRNGGYPFDLSLVVCYIWIYTYSFVVIFMYSKSVFHHSYDRHLGRKLRQVSAHINLEYMKMILIIRAYIVLKHQIKLKIKGAYVFHQNARFLKVCQKGNTCQLDFVLRGGERFREMKNLALFRGRVSGRV